MAIRAPQRPSLLRRGESFRPRKPVSYVRTNLDQLQHILNGLRATAAGYQQAEAETTRLLSQGGAV